MGAEPNIVHKPARNEVQDAYSSHAKVDQVFGKCQLHTLEEGLVKMSAWVREHGARQSQKFEGIEVTKNFPKAWLD
jgi:UDP-glucose 4-epimerase